MGNYLCTANCSTEQSESEEIKVPEKFIYTNTSPYKNYKNFPKINFQKNRLKEHKNKAEDISDDELDYNINNSTQKVSEINLKNSMKNYFNKNNINNTRNQIKYNNDKKEEINRLSSNSQENNNRIYGTNFSFKKRQSNIDKDNNIDINTNSFLNENEKNSTGKITYKPTVLKDKNYSNENENNVNNNKNEEIFQKYDYSESQTQNQNNRNNFENNINNNNLSDNNNIINNKENYDNNKNISIASFDKNENQLKNNNSKNNLTENSNIIFNNVKNSNNNYNKKSRNPNVNINKNNTQYYDNIKIPDINSNIISENNNIKNSKTIANTSNLNINNNNTNIVNNNNLINNNNDSIQYNNNLLYSNNNNYIQNKNIKRAPQNRNKNNILQQIGAHPIDLTPEQIDYIFEVGNKKALILNQNKKNNNAYNNYQTFGNAEVTQQLGINANDILPIQNETYEEKPQIRKNEISPKRVITKQNNIIQKTIVNKPIINTIVSKKVVQQKPIIKNSFNNNYIFDNTYNNNSNENNNNNYNIYPIKTNNDIVTYPLKIQNLTPQKKVISKAVPNNYNIYPIKTNADSNNISTNTKIYQNITPQKKVITTFDEYPVQKTYKHKSPQNNYSNIKYIYNSPVTTTQTYANYSTPTKVIQNKNIALSPVITTPTIVYSPKPIDKKITPNNIYNQTTYVPANNNISQVPYVVSTNYRKLTPDIQNRQIKLVQSPVKQIITYNLNSIPNNNNTNNIHYVNTVPYVTGNNISVIPNTNTNNSIINQNYLKIIQNQNMNALNNYKNYQVDSFSSTSSFNSNRSFYSDSPNNRRHYNRQGKPVYSVILNNTPDNRRKYRDNRVHYRHNRFLQGNYDLNSSIISSNSNNSVFSNKGSFSQDARLPLVNNNFNEHYVRNVSPYDSPISTPKSNKKITYFVNDLNNNNINLNNKNLNNINNNNIMNNKNNINLINNNLNNKNIYNLQNTSPISRPFKPENIAQNNKLIISYYSSINCKKAETFSPNSYLYFYPQNSAEFLIPQNEVIGGPREINYLINNNTNLYEKYTGSVNIYNQKHGLGKLNKQTSQLIGTWKNDQFSGWGREIKNNGEVFEGRFINGKLNGKGIYKYMNNLYIGDFINNDKHGKGQMITKEYDYAGEFKNNKINGYGKITFHNCKDGKTEYEGYFKDNIIEGKGVMKWSTGNIYEGEVKNGKMNGYGTFTPKNGLPIKGYFKDGVRININENDVNSQKHYNNLQDNKIF